MNTDAKFLKEKKKNTSKLNPATYKEDCTS